MLGTSLAQHLTLLGHEIYGIDNFQRGVESNLDVIRGFNRKTQFQKVDCRNSYELIKIKNKEFLDKAIKTKIDETAGREGYISPDEDTVDFVLMYIPLENLYHFLLTSEIGSSKTPVIEYAFSKKVILASPQTLMAYLETIRHSMKLFSLQTDTKNILSTHEKVKNEIRKFIDSFDEVTKRLDQTVKSFESLKKTRVDKLEKSFDELDEVNRRLED